MFKNAFLRLQEVLKLLAIMAPLSV